MTFNFKIRKVEFDSLTGYVGSLDDDKLTEKVTAEYNDAYAERTIETVEAESETDAYKVVRDRIERQTGWTVYKIYYDLV